MNDHDAMIGRRPDKTGWYWYQGTATKLVKEHYYWDYDLDEVDQPVWVTTDGYDGTAYVPVWQKADGWVLLGDYSDLDDMPGNFTPLEAPPDTPEPDWTTAPDWAQWWAVQPSGVAYWFRRRPMTFSDETTSQWVAHRSAEGDLCELLDTKTGLQRGIDWRTTLRRRTEVTP